MPTAHHFCWPCAIFADTVVFKIRIKSSMEFHGIPWNSGVWKKKSMEHPSVSENGARSAKMACCLPQLVHLMDNKHYTIVIQSRAKKMVTQLKQLAKNAFTIMNGSRLLSNDTAQMTNMGKSSRWTHKRHRISYTRICVSEWGQHWFR